MDRLSRKGRGFLSGHRHPPSSLFSSYYRSSIVLTAWVTTATPIFLLITPYKLSDISSALTSPLQQLSKAQIAKQDM